MGELTLTKVASSLNRMQQEQENRNALSLFSSYEKEDQEKIAKCFEFLKQSEAATKIAHEKGEMEESAVIAPMTPARRLKVAIELAHFNELASNEGLAKQAEEAAAAGALMSNLFVDYVKQAEEKAAAMPPQFAAMKEKMKDSKDGDGDGKKMEGTGKKDKKDDDKEDEDDKED